MKQAGFIDGLGFDPALSAKLAWRFMDYKKRIDYQIYRFLWSRGNKIARWSGKKMIAIAKKADKEDYGFN